MVSRIIIKKTGSSSYLMGLQKAIHARIITYPGFIDSHSYLDTPNRDSLITISKWHSSEHWDNWYKSDDRADCIKLAEFNSHKKHPIPYEKVSYTTKLTKNESDNTPMLL